MSLARFVEENHDVLVERCRAKVASRTVPKPTDLELEHGIPLFLTQLTRILRDRGSPRGAISRTAGLHGREMQYQGFTVAQVVHDYGDACQSITELALELKAPISTAEFRALNAGLDNAIADAVTAFTLRKDGEASARDGQAANERLGVLAHEIHNFVYAAMLAHEAMRRGSVGAGGKTSALLGTSLVAMRDLVDNVLADVRLTAGIEKMEPISVREFIEGVEVSAILEAKTHGIRLSIAPAPTDLTVTVDRQILRSVIANLLQNAIKFSRRGGEVTLRTRATPGRALIEIEDECGGLPRGSRERLFQPFVQGSEDRSGIGLGLTICRRGVDALGGKLGILDLPGKGCVFSIDLARSALPPPSPRKRRK